MSTCAAIVVAAGRGQRFGGSIPKQYAELGGVPLLRHTLSAFLSHPSIGDVIPVIHSDDETLFHSAVDGLDLPHPVYGGETRQESVRRGLESLASDPPDKILIHDGARPRVSNTVITTVLNALDGGATGAIPVLPVSETLKRIDKDNVITDTVSRENVVRAQTPQGFLFEPLLDSHRRTIDEALTDDAAVLEHCGYAVTTVEGDTSNIKVTSASDLTAVAASLLETRTGTGFDVHRFGPGDHVTLGGVEIPFDRALLGHSDADVVLHAATDAILGAMADGDIGVHFPPTDAAHKDAPSDIFLTFAMERLRRQFGRVVHLDLTVICERPKVTPHRDAIRTHISEIMELPASRISIKATTTEGLGFTGRGEGIACQALATVQFIPKP